MLARAELDDQPARSGLVQKADLKRIEKSGLDQRGFAGPRRAEHSEEARCREPVDHVVDASLTPEEEVRFFACEGAQPRIGQPPPGCAH